MSDKKETRLVGNSFTDDKILINGIPAKEWEAMTNEERDAIRARKANEQMDKNIRQTTAAK